MAPATVSPSDTDPQVQQLIWQRLREMSPSEKAEMTVRLTNDCLALAAAGIRQRHPGADDHEMRMRIGVLRVGPELMLQAFGWDDGEHGY
jgi:hypothetical protein